MELRILPKNIADMIAAGEVVQRPGSVVKERMENAVDAGASQIHVRITDAGRTLIQVIDNGCGMSPDDAVVCFERHATSKLSTAEDLHHILTYGFRGEALASIAAVAEVTLKTRREGDEIGTEVVLEGGEQRSLKEVAAPKGSSFAVRNLFYNIPARRKFLKSDSVELRHIVEEFQRVALTCPDIGFTLNANDKDLHVLKPAKSLKFRILDLLGSHVVGDIMDIHAETSIVGIDGFVGRPESAKKTLGNQFLFVNGRYFRSPYLHKAVMKAYEGLIPEGTTPSYFIYLNVDPASIDVNIHPTKTEIKFEEDSVIFQSLYACIKESMGRNAVAGSIDFDNPEIRDIPIVGKSFSDWRPSDIPEGDPTYNPFNEWTYAGFDKPEKPSVPDYGHGGGYSAHIDKSDNYGALFAERTLPTAQILCVQGRFIFTQSSSGVLVISIRRARERILYERFLKQLSGSVHASQTALFPVEVVVGVEGCLLFEANKEMLSRLGYDIELFGNDSIVVNAVPDGFDATPGKVEAMVGDLKLILSEEKPGLSEMMDQSMAAKFALLGASGGEKISSPLEAQRLVDALMQTGAPEFTPSGRRIISILSIEEIEKRF